MPRIQNRIVRWAVFAGFSLPCGLAMAQNPSEPISKAHLNAAYETVFITRATRAYNEVIPKLAQQAQRQLIQNNPDLKQPIEAAIQEIAIELVDRQGELDLLIARSWAERFSQEELKEISLFYSTPTGSKLARQNTELIAVGLHTAQRWGAQMGLELISRIKQRLAEKGHELK